MKSLIVIPARGGSKRIPRKNVRIICGKPLIVYSIENARSLKETMDVDVAVSTDDEELCGIVKKRGVEVIARPAELATDSVTLDPVIYHAVNYMEEKQRCRYDTVITMQCTSPTLKKETIRSAIEFFERSEWDTVISAMNKPHLSWGVRDGRITKNYEKRLNSQELPANYLEMSDYAIKFKPYQDGNYDSTLGGGWPSYDHDLPAGNYTIKAYALEPNGMDVTASLKVKVVQAIHELDVKDAPKFIYKLPGKKATATVTAYDVTYDGQSKAKKVEYAITSTDDSQDIDPFASNKMIKIGKTNGKITINKNFTVDNTRFFVKVTATDNKNITTVNYSREVTVKTTYNSELYLSYKLNKNFNNANFGTELPA
ncbi:MAG: acylneuraminate cytidylyltransferase family protein, partial [Lachnospiraceae bacterium]|nr:acylneuraminate cytidylyltransferase family protein [Lachnospiraceae bacterium]